MNTLQREFDKQYKKLMKPNKIGALVIAKRCRSANINLSESQIESIESQLRDSADGHLSIDISDEQWSSAGFASEADAAEALNRALQDVVSEIKLFASNLDHSLPELLSETTEHLALSTMKTLKRTARSMLRDRRSIHLAFEANIYSIWGKALDALETHLAVALEAGEIFNHEFRNAAARSNNVVFEVLTRSHARSCQIASEVLSLLLAGHADGAMARWRSLHELSVVCSFIKKHGNEVAERYLLHQSIESCKAAAQYQEYCDRIGQMPFTAEEIADMKENKEILIKRFGKAYGTEYGWAAEILMSRQPRFSDIEKSVDLDHLRPYYRMASHKVHANPRGVFFSLGLSHGTEKILLAGPSNAGLADPGHLTAISLTQVTANLLTTEPNLDRLVMCNILLKISDEVGEKFWAADRRLKMMERRTNRLTRTRRNRRAR